MADGLAAAKGALHNAENYDKSVAKQSGHEYSNASYAAAHKARHEEAPKVAAPAVGLGEELKEKGQNIKQYEDATK